MKKIITLLSLVLFTSPLVVNAQFLKLMDKNTNADITGMSHLLFFGNNQTSFDYSAKVKNISSSTQVVKVRRIYEERLNGSYDYFCWDLCFDSTDALSGDITMPAGSTDSTSFHATYYSGGTNGLSRIRYRFFTGVNPNDTASFIVHFNTTPAGIEQNKGNRAIAAIGPIPADEQINVFIQKAGNNIEVQMLDMTGKILSREVVTQSGTYPIHTAALPAGVYLVRVLENNLITDQAKVVLK